MRKSIIAGVLAMPLAALVAIPVFANELCETARGADIIPHKRMPLENGICHWIQEFKHTTSNANYARECGGFVTTFGAGHGLERPAQAIILSADWGEAKPTDKAACESAYTAATAWGNSCNTPPCTTADWEMIGAPQVRSGTWSENAGVCHLGISFGAANHNFVVVNIDAQAYVMTPQGPVYKRVASRIYNRVKGNGKCFKADTPKRQIRKYEPPGKGIRINPTP